MKPLSDRWHNRTAWDRLAKEKNRLAKPAREEDFLDPLKSVDAPGWLGTSIAGKNVLCLAAGGGRQGPLYAAAGANVTVVDLSPVMLERDRLVAQERKLNLRIIEASMEDLSMLTADQFDIVIHPVSTCYVPDVVPVYQEVARVLQLNGLYISQHKQPVSLQTSLETVQGRYSVKHPYYSKTSEGLTPGYPQTRTHHAPQPYQMSNEALPPEPRPNLVREKGTLEYLHRWDQLLGAMCRAGLVIEDLSEPIHAESDAQPDSFAHRSQFIPPYVRVKARKQFKTEDQPSKIIA